MDDYPVKLGSILFTLVEPHPGHEVAYNRWYERDHFYAGCLVGPGILAGKRWVATRPYKELRDPVDPEIASGKRTGSYLATYWIERSQSEEWGAWGGREVHRLHKEGRMFEHRDHVHTKMYRYEGGTFRDPDGVPPEMALDHPFKGLVAVIGETTGDRGAALDWYRTRPVEDSAAMRLLFTPIPIPDSAPPDIPRIPKDKQRLLALWFLDRDPLDVWEAEFAGHAKRVEASGVARALWAGPFIPTIPGTDLYTDQLR